MKMSVLSFVFWLTKPEIWLENIQILLAMTTPSELDAQFLGSMTMVIISGIVMGAIWAWLKVFPGRRKLNRSGRR